MEVAVEAIHQHFTAWTPRVKPSKDGEARADVGSHKTGWKSTYANNQKIVKDPLNLFSLLPFQNSI